MKYSGLILPSLAVFLAGPQLKAAEAFEIGTSNVAELPAGREVDGVIGDFLLRNDKVVAVISGDLPLRRANMSTFYGPDGITPGCLYDLSERGKSNDQLTAFCPLLQRGPINHIRLVKDGSGPDGEVLLEVFTSAAKSGGVATLHEYILHDGWQGLLIVSTVKNNGPAEAKVKLSDTWTQMKSKGSSSGVDWADALDPADKCGYARGWVAENGAQLPPAPETTLAPGEEIKVARFVAVADSPAAAVGQVLTRTGETGTLRVTIKGPDRQPVPTARAVIAYGPRGGQTAPAYADEQGFCNVLLPPGKYDFDALDTGRTMVRQSTEIKAGAVTPVEVTLDAPTVVAFEVRDGEGASIPCKVQFNAEGDTAKPDLGPVDRAHGSSDQYFSEKGDFMVPVPPGTYRIVITRGPEFGHHEETVTLAPGQNHKINTVLRRQVATPGWIATDYHNHSTQSGDNTCGTDDRLINLAAEGLEFAPTTEHNRLYDWRPHIERLGLAPYLNTVAGMELTGAGAHFNSFPFQPEPRWQDNGAPVWQKDPRLNAIVLRDFQGAEPTRWIHVNHPDMVENFIDRDKDGRPDGGYKAFGQLIDGLETQNYRNSDILATAPYRLVPGKGGLGHVVQIVPEFIWLQLLNRGLAPRAVAVTDSHQVYGNGVGSWRTYVKSSTDDPAMTDWTELSAQSKGGHMVLSSGPYLEVSTAAGAIAGDLERANGSVALKVRVQCADWLDIDRVQVLVNGRQAPEYNYTRENNPEKFQNGVVKFDQTLTIKLSEDANLIVVATGEKSTLAKGFGTSTQATLHPTAYNNPIFIDVDGSGFQPNGDTLGYDLPVGGLTVDEVRAALRQPEKP
ncbi:MAG: CehA/McbA family metallohydrolase [Verrucomicrobiales bacterium]